MLLLIVLPGGDCRGMHPPPRFVDSIVRLAWSAVTAAVPVPVSVADRPTLGGDPAHGNRRPLVDAMHDVAGHDGWRVRTLVVHPHCHGGAQPVVRVREHGWRR